MGNVNLSSNDRSASQWCLLALFLVTLMSHFSGAASADEGAFIGAMATEYPEWFKESFLEIDQDVAEAKDANRRVMILFHQDGCPYCNAFVERNLAEKDIEETLKTGFDVISINMWGDREVAHVDGKTYSEKSFAAALKVQFTPTILFLDEKGQAALRLNGYYGPQRFRLALDYVGTKRDSDMSFGDYLNANGIDKGAKDSETKLASKPYLLPSDTDLSARPGKSEKPLVLLFEQKGSANCQVLHDNVLSNAESMELLQKLDIYQVDMWGTEEITAMDGTKTTGRDLAKALAVNYAPTLIVYSPGGEEVIRSEAYFKSFHTQSILDYVISDGYKTEASFQRYIAERADRIRATGKDVNIWQ